MMQSDLPIYDSPEDALRAAVQMCGGAKVVGARLWGDLAPDHAARRLMDCLNAGRPEKLELTQVMFVLRLAHEAGMHSPMVWLAAELGYEVRPVTQAEQVTQAALVVRQTSATLAAALATLERLQRGGGGGGGGGACGGGGPGGGCGKAGAGT